MNSANVALLVQSAPSNPVEPVVALPETRRQLKVRTSIRAGASMVCPAC